jgi:hypothetical protein
MRVTPPRKFHLHEFVDGVIPTFLIILRVLRGAFGLPSREKFILVDRLDSVLSQFTVFLDFAQPAD